jgi:hypothetical protein
MADEKPKPPPLDLERIKKLVRDVRNVRTACARAPHARRGLHASRAVPRRRARAARPAPVRADPRRTRSAQPGPARARLPRGWQRTRALCHVERRRAFIFR